MFTNRRVKIAKAMGCVVTVISHSESKKAFATECGADHFITSSRPSDMEGARKSLDLILNTIPVMHDYTSYVENKKNWKKNKDIVLAYPDPAPLRSLPLPPPIGSVGFGSVAGLRSVYALTCARSYNDVILFFRFFRVFFSIFFLVPFQFKGTRSC